MSEENVGIKIDDVVITVRRADSKKIEIHTLDSDVVIEE